jgi:hypothetical protein
VEILRGGYLFFQTKIAQRCVISYAQETPSSYIKFFKLKVNFRSEYSQVAFRDEAPNDDRGSDMDGDRFEVLET